MLYSIDARLSLPTCSAWGRPSCMASYRLQTCAHYAAAGTNRLCSCVLVSADDTSAFFKALLSAIEVQCRQPLPGPGAQLTWEPLACLCLLRERAALLLRSGMRVKLVDSRIT